MNHLLINGNSNFNFYCSTCQAGSSTGQDLDQFSKTHLRITSPGVQLFSPGGKSGEMGSRPRDTGTADRSRKNHELAASTQVLSSLRAGLPRDCQQANDDTSQNLQIRIGRYYVQLQRSARLEATVLRYFGANSSFTRITLEEAPQPTAGRMSKPSGGTGPNIPLPERFRKSSNNQVMNEKVLAIVTLVGVFLVVVMVDLWSKRIDRKRQEKARKEYKKSRIGGRS